ncbi:flagellar hook-length control protein FliK [Halomonas mongoliensis]|uniref:flagellar hook-length control protein FliK n=1 Tax=Halomonas mongoliensis TaxID=321265 RepID=UPI00403B2B6F
MDIALLLSTLGDTSRTAGVSGGSGDRPSQGFADMLAGLDPSRSSGEPSPAQLHDTFTDLPRLTAVLRNLSDAAKDSPLSPADGEGTLAEITRRLQLIASAGDGVADLHGDTSRPEGRLDLRPSMAPLTHDAHTDPHLHPALDTQPDEPRFQDPRQAEARLDDRPARPPGMQASELPAQPLLRTATADAGAEATVLAAPAMSALQAIAVDATGSRAVLQVPPTDMAADSGQKAPWQGEGRQPLADLRNGFQAASGIENAPRHPLSRPAVVEVSGSHASTSLHTAEPGSQGLSEPRQEGGWHLTALGTAGSTAATASAASATSPSQGSLTAPLTSPAWPAQLGQQLVLLGQRGGEQRAELHLNPAELGPLTISLKLSEQGAQAQFLSAHASVRQAVEQAIPQLREALAEQGISLGDTSVGEQRQQQPGEQEQRAVAVAGAASGQKGGSEEMELLGTAEPLVPLPAEGRVDLYA